MDADKHGEPATLKLTRTTRGWRDIRPHQLRECRGCQSASLKGKGRTKKKGGGSGGKGFWRDGNNHLHAELLDRDVHLRLMTGRSQKGEVASRGREREKKAQRAQASRRKT